MVLIAALPEEIVLAIVSHLDARSFLSVCSTCHYFQDAEEIRHSALYWRALVRESFRVPNFSVIASDGRRWEHMYRRMSKETRILFWGNNDGGAAGVPRDNQNILWPIEVNNLGNSGNGIIADLQCGGWSIAILTSQGELYLNGTLGNGAAVPVGKTVHLTWAPVPTPCDKSSFRIRQFSLGRSNLLGLSDGGNLWSWTNGLPYATGVLFPNRAHGKVQKVIAGWEKSSALVKGEGILMWNALPPVTDKSMGRDIALKTFWRVPGTKSLASDDAMGKPPSRSPADAKVVTNWILLEGFVVWLTRTGQLFAARIPQEDSLSPVPFELTRASSPCMQDPRKGIIDVQGSFRSFAVLMLNGEVLTSDTEYLAEMENPDLGRDHLPTLRKIPSLQHTGVISLAFGDWHFHALHTDGGISSYGREMKYCGALGLLARAVRGLASTHTRGAWVPDGVVMPVCYTTGRRVFFEREKRAWLAHACRPIGGDTSLNSRRLRMLERDDVKAEVSEFFEWHLRRWEQPAAGAADDDGLPAYFPVAVVAGGWHSAALVLVNDAKAARQRQRFIRPVERVPSPPAPAPIRGAWPGAASAARPDAVVPPRVIERAYAAANSTLRGFLGLRGDVTSSPSSPPGGDELASDWEWVWKDARFPRLRLKSGEVMPGDEDEPIEDWTAPEWKETEQVSL